MTEVRILIGIIGALGLAVLIGNFIVNGVDIPQGILYILGIVFGALFSPELAEKIRGGMNGKKNKKDPEDKP